MKVMYKIVCNRCSNIVERATKPTEHNTITLEGKICPCGSVDLKLWKSA